jgi:hypothetical protein
MAANNVKANIKANKKDLKRLNAKLRKINLGTQKNVTEVLKWFTLDSVNEIKKDAPVDTSNLIKSINGNMINKNSAFVESIALGEDKFDYAPVQEFGSVYRKGKPYFYPNIYKSLKKAIATLKSKNKRTVKK